MNLKKLIRPNILVMQPYSSARDEFEGKGEVYLDANENPFETGLNRYPDPYQKALKKEVSKLKGVKEENIFLGNGSDEAIDLILRIFCRPGQDNIVITDPTYGMYQVAASIQDVEVFKVPLTMNFGLDSHDLLTRTDRFTKIIFLCSPNNPTGNDLDFDEIIKIIENFEGIVVIDEAYIDFTNEPGFGKLIDKYSNLIVLQTFSKAWGMAGIRLGMAFASWKIILYFNKVKPPYNLNILTQQKALEHLENSQTVKENTGIILVEREKLKEELLKIDLVKNILPSSANFLLVRFDDAARVFNYLIDKNIVVRDRSKSLRCEGCLRITVGTKVENKKLINALTKLEEQPIKE